MMFSQIVLCALLVVTGINGKPPKAIVRGERASEKEFPYLVSLTIFGEQVCGGVIIDPTHVLTVVHCVEYPGFDMVHDMVVVSGTINGRQGNRHLIKSIKTHEAFVRTVGVTNDIAMITLRTPIEFNDYQNAVHLPTQNTTENVTATASGWGDLSYPNGAGPTELWKLNLQVITNSECDADLPNITISDGHLCAMPRMDSGLCAGDSGGPLVSDGVLIGIASFVIPCGIGYPDVFTRVYHYLDWIEETRNNSRPDQATVATTTFLS